MQVNVTPISDRRVWAATLITVLGWGGGWYVCTVYLLNRYFDHSGPSIAVIAYYLAFGIIGITATLIGLWLARARLAAVYTTLIYLQWSLTTVPLFVLLISPDTFLISVVWLIPMVLLSITLGWILKRSVEGLDAESQRAIALSWIVALCLSLILLFVSKNLIYWLVIQSIAFFVSCLFAGRVIFWRIQRAQIDQPIMPEKEKRLQSRSTCDQAHEIASAELRYHI